MASGHAGGRETSRWGIPLLCLTASLLLTPGLTPAATTRLCGWLENPGPGDIWLTTSHAVWWLEKQGQEINTGLESLPNYPRGQWRSNPIGYGYGCACVSGEFDLRHKQLLHLQSLQPRSRQFCRQIPQLQEPQW